MHWLLTIVVICALLVAAFCIFCGVCKPSRRPGHGTRAFSGGNECTNAPAPTAPTILLPTYHQHWQQGSNPEYLERDNDCLQFVQPCRGCPGGNCTLPALVSVPAEISSSTARSQLGARNFGSSADDPPPNYFSVCGNSN